MALTVKTKTGTTLAYGVDGEGGTGSALITSMGTAVATAGDTSAPMIAVTSAEVGAEFTVNTTAKNGAGTTVAHLVGSEKNTLKVDGFASAFAVPKVGGTITHGGVSGAVISSSIVASNEDFVKASLNAEGGRGIDYSA